MRLAAQVEARLEPVCAQLAPVQGLGDMFARCFMNTLETTCQTLENGEVFIITGDIQAMWLRDSTEQILHYLRFAPDCPELSDWICAVIRRQTALVLTDPYANAFNLGPNGRHGYQDQPPAGPWVWERKYELDSLCHVVLLAWRFHRITGRTDFMTTAFFAAMERILDLIATEQNHEAQSPYSFQRSDCPPSDTLPHQGKGTPVGVTGMSWSGFRPSDDACQYGYLIPANLFAATELEHLCAMARACGREDLAERARTLAEEIRQGVRRYGIAHTADFGEIYAYEADGLGKQLLMDDANIPSLLSLPYLEVCSPDDELYLRTRAFVLSKQNPCFYAGRAACGIGSPHTPEGYVWPIALCIQGMTALDANERVGILRTLLTTHAGTARMHESFDPNDPSQFTRSWFAWANSMFGELVYRMYEKGELPEAVRSLVACGITSVHA